MPYVRMSILHAYVIPQMLQANHPFIVVPGAKISVKLHLIDGLKNGFAIQLNVAPPPIIRSLSISPSTGFSLQTQFSLTLGHPN